MNHQPYTLEPLPRKVGNFIRRLDQDMQERISVALAHIVRSPFRHTNPTIIKRLRGRKKERYRYRIGHLRFIYRVDRNKRLIRILQIDNRGDIY